MFVVGVIVHQATRFIPFLIMIFRELPSMRRIVFRGPTAQKLFVAILPQSAEQRDAAKETTTSWLVVWIQPH